MPRNEVHSRYDDIRYSKYNIIPYNHLVNLGFINGVNIESTTFQHLAINIADGEFDTFGGGVIKQVWTPLTSEGTIFFFIYKCF